MKKILAVILSVLMLATLTACGNNADKKDDATTTTTTTAQKTEEPASTVAPLDVMTTVMGAYTPEFSYMGGDYTNMMDNMDKPGKVNVGNEEAGMENLFVCSAENQALVDDAASVVHAMNGNVFTGVVYHLKDAASVDTFKTSMTDAIKNNHWMCGAPEKLAIIAVDSQNVVVVYGAVTAVDPFVAQVKTSFGAANVLVEEDLAL